MNTVANVKKVALLFFILFTGGHILSTLMLANDYFSDTMRILNGTLDIPAILSGLLYGFTSLKLYLEDMGKHTKPFDLVAGILGGIILLALLYVNFLL
ncbi:hypothetical protein HN748_05085 [Candidatus Peregrinibacteria bacterium]|jgi:hypothetical protein|nr:hypothetical protein [Candidatus Peregrinibacteria bacterium]MBT7484418.1 hypothetical protein [Candidatus Peregrinibacteria bacterium]MBT7703584.1 hypothetical protein [Candidatus Peregrinibacteria bacterium]